MINAIAERGMREDKSTKEQHRTFTIWIMKDRTAEPIQYQVNVRTLKSAVFCLAAILVMLPTLLVVTGARCSHLAGQNRDLAEISRKYQVSQDELNGLQERVIELEGKVTLSCNQTRKIISGMEKELVRWIPKGAVGGGEDSEASGKTALEAPPLSPSQIEQVNDIQIRLARLENKIDSYEVTVGELEQAWDDRNSIFSAFPSLWPVAEGRITSEFGMRIHPISHKLQMHEGIDIAAPAGTPIHATAPGIVTFVGRKNGYGNAVLIDHGYGLSSFYAHCSVTLVKTGDQIEKGEIIAKVGSTGYSTGPHLHFEVRVRGVQVDPTQYLSVFSPGPLENEP